MRVERVMNPDGKTEISLEGGKRYVYYDSVCTQEFGESSA